jgi:hypothetical protein
VGTSEVISSYEYPANDGRRAPAPAVTVYVDHAFAVGDWGRWTGGGHLQADSAEELHAFAARMGLLRQWFQCQPGRPEKDHYDLPAAARRLALSLGAVNEDRRAGTRRRRMLREARLRAGQPR